MLYRVGTLILSIKTEYEMMRNLNQIYKLLVASQAAINNKPRDGIDDFEFGNRDNSGAASECEPKPRIAHPGDFPSSRKKPFSHV
jgi:hypothetical protein